MVHLRTYTNKLPQPVRFGLRRIAFRGNQIVCPLCENRLRGYAAHAGGAPVLDRRKVVGGMRREDDRCPVCHGCDRTRMMMMYLSREAGLGSVSRSVLHVAPDYGLYLWLMRQPNLEYTASDLDASRYRHISNMRTADLTNTPFESNSFDIVICSHVLEHVPDDLKAMGEIRRILKPGGRALLLVPLATDGAGTDEDPSITDPKVREDRFGQWDHVRIYGREDFLDRMKEAGFDTIVYDPSQSAPAEAERMHLNPLEVLPVGFKS